jgi:hypothetical protein
MECSDVLALAPGSTGVTAARHNQPVKDIYS